MSGLSSEAINEVVHRRALGQSIRGIARSMCLCAAHRSARTDRARWRNQQQGSPHPELPRRRRRQGSVIDDYEEAIGGFIKRYPDITVIRLLEELRALGYQGGYSILRERVKTLRVPVPAQPVQRLRRYRNPSPDGLGGVHDGVFGGRERQVDLFSYLLGYSRRQYLHFTEPDQDFETLLRQHIRAFEHLGGVAATCIYDNMKTVVDRWEEGEPLYNTRFLGFATHYGFRPRHCWPRRPQTKGKVERPFSYVELNLLNGRSFTSLEQLNQITQVWLANTADLRVHRGTGKRPIDAHAKEQAPSFEDPLEPLRHRPGRLSRSRCQGNDRLREQLLFDPLAVRRPDVASTGHRARVDRLRSGQLGRGSPASYPGASAVQR